MKEEQRVEAIIIATLLAPIFAKELEENSNAIAASVSCKTKYLNAATMLADDVIRHVKSRNS